jgi:hypothetical protein
MLRRPRQRANPMPAVIGSLDYMRGAFWQGWDLRSTINRCRLATWLKFALRTPMMQNRVADRI